MIRALPAPRPIHVAVLVILALCAAVLVAQIEGERGIPPIASSADYEVGDVHVDVYGPNAEAARAAGWRLAQRLAWRKLARQMASGAGNLPDSAIGAMVAAIEVEREQIGPNRYIATLAVMFNRTRAGAYLGAGGPVLRSPPLLVIPVLTDGGVSSVFEYPSEWQKAWALFRTGESAIDYVRTSGAGGDAILLTAGQIDRPGRNWWRTLLDQYGAADVIMPLARLERLGPDGPVVGHFAARYGPDNRYIGSFELRVARPAAIPAMMTEAVRRMDSLYTRALQSGILRPDPSLTVEEPDNAMVGDEDPLGTMPEFIPVESAPGASLGETQYVIQYETPGVASVGQGEAMMRSIPGVRTATTTSLALGGISVMQVTTTSTPEELRIALSARGYSVQGQGTTWRIQRRAGPAAAPPPGGDAAGQVNP